jgi:hypothetical protein
MNIGRRLLFGSLVSLLLLQPLLADEFVNISDIEDCRGITASAERLLCFDTVADGGVFNEQKLQQVQEENFGSKEAAPVVSVDKVTVTVVRITKSSTGVHYFYTDNDKAWKQSNGGRWTVKAPFEAEIKKGLMGSFFLVTEGGKSERVKRVK